MKKVVKINLQKVKKKSILTPSNKNQGIEEKVAIVVNVEIKVIINFE